MIAKRWIFFSAPLILVLAHRAGSAPSTPANPATAGDGFQKSVQPLLATYCYGCHSEKLSSGGLNLRTYSTGASALADREKWERVLARMEAGEMPPKGLPRPDPAAMKTATAWIHEQFDRADATAKPHAGRVTARRLNRPEYNNTVRDLLGVDFRPADDFPQDDSGYGFDNIADALSLSPVLMEKYLAAAEKAVNTAIFGYDKLKPTVVRHQPAYREKELAGITNGSRLPMTISDYDFTGMTLSAALHATHTFPVEGDYEFRVDPEGTHPQPSEPFKVAIWLDGKQVSQVEFEATTNGTGMEGLDQVVMLHMPAGEHWIAASPLRLYDGLPAKYGGLNPTKKPDPPARAGGGGGGNFQLPPDATPEQKAAFEARQKAIAAGGGGGRGNRPPGLGDISFKVNFIEISGPFNPVTKPSTESLKKIFVCPEKTPACGRRIVASMARRAFRRTPTATEVTRYTALLNDDMKRGATFEQGVAIAVEAMMVSPNFLFRIESDPKPVVAGDSEHALSDFELASRLSYFLWSSMPDEMLLRAAENKTLHTSLALNAQVKRMLKDLKAKAFVENFGGQWLQFRALESVQPDPGRFQAFNDYLRMSMKQETSMFFENLLQTDGDITDFLNGKYSFLNEQLATYYGIPGVKGAEFRRVDLSNTNRGGVVTQGSVLTASSYATRTSVVLRGKWVLENLLNAPVPPPPANVPALDETAVGTSMSLRQQMETHRANAICASCHARMDPIGFGLENFDAIGRWRTTEGKFPIDSSGTLPDGKTFHGPEELKGILVANREAFAQGLAEKMLTYALGRGLEPADKPAVKAIAQRVIRNNYRISELMLGIVNSVPFQKRKGDRAGDDRHA